MSELTSEPQENAIQNQGKDNLATE